MKFIPLILIVLLLSCATNTTIVRVVDKSVPPQRFSKIAVTAPYNDLQIRSSVESRVAERLTDGLVTCYRTMDILPPLREYRPEEIFATFDSLGIQAVFVIAVTDYWATSVTVGERLVTEHSPSTTETASTLSYGQPKWVYGADWGRLTSVSVTHGGKETTRYEPGITVTQTNVSLDARLFRFDTHTAPTMVWRSNSTTSGNYFTPGSEVMGAAVEKIRQLLKEDGVLVAPMLPVGTISDQVTHGFRVQQDLATEVWDATVVSPIDGSIVLGCLSCTQWNEHSILNANGLYGKTFQYSVWKIDGIYGADSSDCGVCNENALNPPKIIGRDGRLIGWVSLNPAKPSNYKDSMIREWLLREVCDRK